MIGARWLFIVVVTAVTFRGSLTSVVEDIAAGGAIVQVCCPVVTAVAAAFAVRRRGRRMLPIHDRETDIIVGVAALALAVSSASLLAPRLAAVYYLWRLDLLFVWLFVFGAAVLMFGLRPTTHYRVAWLVLALIWPFPVRVVTLSLTNDLRLVAAIELLVAVFVIDYGRRPDDRLRRLPTVVAAILGAGAVALVPAARPAALVVVPTVVALFAGLATRRVTAGRVTSPAATRALVVTRAPRAALGLAVGGVVASFLIPGPPAQVAPSVPTVHRTAYAPGQFVPATGWQVVSAEDIESTRKYFGVTSSWTRTQLVSTGPRWVDPAGRQRHVVTDVLTVPRASTLITFPVTTTYPMGDLRLGPQLTVDLGDGVSAQTYGAVDESRQLTWTLLTFTWTLPAAVARPPQPGDSVGPDDTLTQRVTLMAVDDHRPGAPFPEPAAAVGNSVRAVLTRIVRGDQSQLAAAGSAKDTAMLVSVGRGIVENVTGTP